MRCQHTRLSWDILFGKGICPDCNAKIVAYNEWPSTEVEHKPIAWVAKHERGTVNHYSIADGWEVEVVQTIPPPQQDSRPQGDTPMEAARPSAGASGKAGTEACHAARLALPLTGECEGCQQYRKHPRPCPYVRCELRDELYGREPQHDGDRNVG